MWVSVSKGKIFLSHSALPLLPLYAHVLSLFLAWTYTDDNEERRRKIASWSIAFVCIGILILASAASVEGLSRLANLSFTPVTLFSEQVVNS